MHPEAGTTRSKTPTTQTAAAERKVRLRRQNESTELASTQEDGEDELRQEDAHEHGQGIDRGIAHGRGVVARGGIGKCEGGRVGVGAGNEAHEGEVVELHLQPRKDADQEDGHGGDEEAHPDVVHTVALGDGVPERGAGLNAHTAEEEHESDFAQEEVGRGGNVGVDLIAVAHGADEDGDDERSAGQAEFDGHGDAGNGDGNLPHDDTDEDAEEDGAHVGVVEVFDLCADHIFEALDVFLRAGDQNAVADLQTEVACGEEVHAVAGDTGDVDVVERGDVELREAFAVDFGSRHDKAAADVLFAFDFLLVSHFDELTEELADAFGVLFGANKVDLHVLLEHGFASRDEKRAVGEDAARNDELDVEELVERFEGAAFGGAFGDANHQVFGRRGGIVLFGRFQSLAFLFKRGAGEEAHGDGGQNDAHHAEGIGAGIAVGDDRHVFHARHQIGQHVVGRAETGGVGHRSVEHAHHHGEIVGRVGVAEDAEGGGEEVEADHHGHIEEHEAEGEHVHAQTARFEGLEEAGTHLQSDAVDEKNEAELLDHVDHVLLSGDGGDRVCIKIMCADVSDENTDEEYPRHAEGDTVFTADAPTSQADAETDDQGIQNNQMS